MNYELVIFDWDGTLMDSTTVIAAALPPLIARYRPFVRKSPDSHIVTTVYCVKPQKRSMPPFGIICRQPTGLTAVVGG